MKRCALIVTLSLAGSTVAPGQGGFIAHIDSVQAGRSGSGISVRQVSDGYLVFSRQFSQQFPTRSHVYVRKLDESGQFQYEHEHRVGDDRNFDIGYIDAVANRQGGGYAAALAEGYAYPGETWLYTFDGTGDTLSRQFLMTFPVEDSVTHAIRQTRATDDGGYVLCGFFHRPIHSTRAFLVRIGNDGDTLWTRRFGVDGQAMVALGVEEYPDGGFLLTGYRSGGSFFNRSFLIRTDANGEQLWRRDYGYAATQNGAVRITAEGDIITWSTYAEPAWANNWKEMMLTKWDPSGSIIWQRKYFYQYITTTWDLEILSDGTMVGTGISLNKGVLVKFTAEGDTLWHRQYSILGGAHYLYDVESTSDGGFVCTGVAWRSPFTDVDIQSTQVIWVVKTDSLGCVVPGCHTVGVEEYLLDLNEHLRIWPNPLSRGTPLQISFTPPPEFTPNGPLRVVLLDATGRQVHEESIGTGTGTCQLAHLPLAAGLYHLHLTDGTRWLAGAKVVVAE